MKNHTLRICNRHKLFVYLIAGKCLFTDLLLLFLSHRCPNICINNISVLCSLHWVFNNFKFAVAVLFTEFNNVFRRHISLWASCRERHTCAECADNERVHHIVAVTDKAHFKSLKFTLKLTDSHKVCEHLTWVAVVCKTVDNRNRAVLGESLNLFLLKCSDHNTVKKTRENSCCILNRLASADL